MPKMTAVEANIKYCIEKNGFPEKSVRLPFKAIHENCKNHDIALKEVLANLDQYKIIGTILGDFIECRASDKPKQKAQVSSKENKEPNIKIPNMENLKEMAQSYMSKMSPEQIKELGNTVSNMGEEERNKILKNFSQQFFKNNQ